MGFYQLKRKIELKAGVDDVWKFVSCPSNLKKITPGYMMFDIISEDIPGNIYEGLIISYIVAPIAGIKTRWVSEITHVKDMSYFVDEQRVGPYKIWHHQHFLSKTENGTMMSDIVSYKPPFGFIGSIFNYLFIRRKLNEIFDFRTSAMEELFGIV